MGFIGQLTTLITVGLIALLYYQFRNITKPLKAPILDVDYYWGPGDRANYQEDTQIHSKLVQYDDTIIKDLQKKLNETLPLHAPLEGVQHEYGINSNTFMEFLDYWKNVYITKWVDRQDLINSFPHYQTQIQG